jgi:hypothetical protein
MHVWKCYNETQYSVKFTYANNKTEKNNQGKHSVDLFSLASNRAKSALIHEFIYFLFFGEEHYCVFLLQTSHPENYDLQALVELRSFHTARFKNL